MIRACACDKAKGSGGGRRLFQCLEKGSIKFPILGKIGPKLSKDWKIRERND